MCRSGNQISCATIEHAFVIDSKGVPHGAEREIDTFSHSPRRVPPRRRVRSLGYQMVRRYRLPVRPHRVLQLAPPFTVLPTRFNWLRMAPETCGPANTTTRPMTAAINTYSMIDCPWRRVPLGDTPPPRRKCRCMHIAAPFAQGLQIRAKGRGGRRFLWQSCRSGKVSSHVLDRTPTGLHCFTPTELHAKHLAGI